MNNVSVAVVGATGYAGGELTALLASHPGVEIAALFSGEKGATAPFSALHPSLAGCSGPSALPFTKEALLASGASIVFLATPNEVSAKLVPELLDAGLRVVDLSGAFRLTDPTLYPSWYGFEHDRPSLLNEAVYGLPEWCDSDLTSARLVANPGCYPTAIVLALRPLAFVVDREQPIIADAQSGVSGGGKKSAFDWSFGELFGNCKAYGVAGHRHDPEIRQLLHLGDRTTFVFVPHLLPVFRGILATMHVGFSRPIAESELQNLYARAYGDTPFVRVLAPGKLPELKDVVQTPYAEVGFQLLQGGRRAVIVSAIDNLLKGAASQAVQNLNRMCGFEETEGLMPRAAARHALAS